ncbi:PRC-barrel domain-containing protein [Alkaliphilus hydrothermalis]|uniref:Uncharacterized protein YrrD n=1 Tax=Alkaliphilus hydrothermalis TaxID=1482730 RepID=A0ABS2NLX1_9FIRM|nr:PRC-barrel domain-containing protein [Alkaliphilus hydrothermalis]MBM7613940.1 uncharacterized protein YrrD [Alkaliphilus hydrothermalis]
MKKGSEFIGSPIIKANNELLDFYVQEPIYCTSKSRVLGLLVQQHLKSKEKFVIQYKKIKDFNSNGIVIQHESEILSPHQVPEIEAALNRTTAIIGFEIYGVSGDLVGVVKDTLIDLKSGKIVDLIISEGVLTDLMQGYSIFPLSNSIDFNQNNIIVDYNQFQNGILYHQGGLKKMLGIEQHNKQKL